MARTLNLIIDSEHGRLRRWFDDPTPTTVAEMLGGGFDREDDVTLNVFIGQDEGGVFRSQDLSTGFTALDVTISRPSRYEAKTGFIRMTVGVGEAATIPAPLTADNLQTSLNAMTEIQTGCTRVAVQKNGNVFTIQGQGFGTIGTISYAHDGMPLTVGIVDSGVTGDANNYPSRILRVYESPLLSTNLSSNTTAPDLTESTLQAGSASIYEIQQLEVTGFPDSGEAVLTSGVTSPVRFALDASPAAIKAAINAADAGRIARVEKTGRHRWQLFFSALADATQITGSYYGTAHKGKTGNIDLDTTATGNIFACEGTNYIDVSFDITGTASPSIDTYYHEDLRVYQRAHAS